MYTLLIVDDERIAVRGLKQGVVWSDLAITEIVEAYNVKQAKLHFASQQIDIMICDIEMPGKNGIELLEWVKEHYSDTVTLFLTGHADFDYVQKALQLGSFDYILKPVKHDYIKKITEQALIQRKQNEENKVSSMLYKQYAKQWEEQIPHIIERFWQELLSERTLPKPQHLASTLQQLGIPLTPDGQILPILISIEMWKEEFTARDEQIMEYALRKAASELMLASWPGIVVQDRNGINLVLIYLNANNPLKSSDVRDICGEYIRYCNHYFKCSLSCYIGESTKIAGIPQMYRDLLAMERNNVTASNKVLSADEYSMPFTDFSAESYPIMDWIMQFELGRIGELLEQIMERCAYMEQKDGLYKEELESLRTSVLFLLFSVFHKKGLSVYDAFPSKQLVDGSVTLRTLTQFRTWMDKVISQSFEHYKQYAKEDSEVVTRTKIYISENLHQEIPREDIAANVFLNPSYLSRLFKKETGVSLSDYILKEKMTEAKRLLAQTEMQITQIAEALGYMNLSHFITMFKKFNGTTPMNFRKKI
ncbi:response regulator [Cohnella sp.]|uniref:response regulator transcription factor n=1 Tax=Cohnella sp. TaxID=1883426 RepID=UPI00356841CA